MLAACLVIAAATAAQALIAQALGSAWWVPQLAVVALVRQISRRPRAWLSFAVVAAASLMVLVLRWPGALVLWLVACAGAWRAAMWCWNVEDPRLQAAAAGLAAGALIFISAAFDRAVSWPLLALAVWQAVITAGCAAAWAAAQPQP